MGNVETRFTVLRSTLLSNRFCNFRSSCNDLTRVACTSVSKQILAIILAMDFFTKIFLEIHFLSTPQSKSCVTNTSFLIRNHLVKQTLLLGCRRIRCRDEGAINDYTSQLQRKTAATFSSRVGRAPGRGKEREKNQTDLIII